MEYETIKKRVEHVKMIQSTRGGRVIAFRWERNDYESREDIEVLDASLLFSNFFTQLNAFESDFEEMNYIFGKYRFLPEDVFISEHMDDVLETYVYYFGDLWDFCQFYEHMVVEKEYKNYTPRQIKLMWDMLKEYTTIYFTDEMCQYLYDVEERKEILDWYLEICENNHYNKSTIPSTYIDEEIDWDLELHDYKRTDQYICDQCDRKITCCGTAYILDKVPQKVLCEDCLPKAAIFESIKTELFFSLPLIP